MSSPDDNLRRFHRPALRMMVAGAIAFLAMPALGSGPDRAAIDAALKRATTFMMQEVATRGPGESKGFLWNYSADLKTVRWGELPARPSQIWVEPPSTTSVGLALVALHDETRDPEYRAYADQVARAVIWGQRPTGGWDLNIDFEPEGTPQWRRDVARKSWGWEEHYYDFNNADLDDDNTTSAIRFLLRLYGSTLDPAYRPALTKALTALLDAQHPSGGWPQRFPRSTAPGPEYPSFFTFNDSVMANTIQVLLEAATVLGDDRYRAAAIRGMDFYIVSQLGAPQAGWAQQYTHDMRPAKGRSYEPGAVAADQTVENIRDLLTWYQATGDRRYLNPIPRALEWLEHARLTPDAKAKVTHAKWYEAGTNRPIYVYRDGTGPADERYWTDHEPHKEHFYPMGRPWRLDLDALRKEVARVSAQGVEAARAEYQASTRAWPHMNRIDSFNDFRIVPIDGARAAALVAALDARGAWVTETDVPDRVNFMRNPRQKFQGIVTGVYVANVYRLLDYRRRLASGK